jgi:hypothetical protein
MVHPEVHAHDRDWVRRSSIAALDLAGKGHEPPTGLLGDGGRQDPGRASIDGQPQLGRVLLGPDGPILGSWMWRSSRTLIAPVVKRQERRAHFFLKVGKPTVRARSPFLALEKPSRPRASASRPLE